MRASDLVDPKTPGDKNDGRGESFGEPDKAQGECGEHHTSTAPIKKVRRIASWSFWLIAAAHITAFTAIGVFTPRGWRLLGLFLTGLAVILAIRYAFKIVKHYKNR